MIASIDPNVEFALSKKFSTESKLETSTQSPLNVLTLLFLKDSYS